MKASWTRRATLALATAGAATLLAACGDGSVISDLKPTRFITVGDSFADVGQSAVADQPLAGNAYQRFLNLSYTFSL